MAFNVITFLQLAVFVVILFNINLHSASAGSKEQSASQVSETSITAEFCDTNCTLGTDKTWSGCRGGCFCVHVGNDTEGRCMKWDGDSPSVGAEE
uniref:Putative basic tail protein n=1 Tax=Ixodes ricinus TaxID=34613 RepID=A0A0K8RJH0_IXORI